MSRPLYRPLRFLTDRSLALLTVSQLFPIVGGSRFLFHPPQEGVTGIMLYFLMEFCWLLPWLLLAAMTHEHYHRGHSWHMASWFPSNPFLLNDRSDHE